ncbi:MAG: hypothetical protein K0Q74_1027 [Gammaproteobacteria bacterium]|jgi:hypothetical protein|nr:hypothetical protein [Gammaproteobacteria bacterium]
MTTIGQVQIRKQVADRLKKARQSAGYKTAKSFCTEHNIDLKQYLKQEEGKAAIKASHAVLYARCLNVSLFWLMLGED